MKEVINLISAFVFSGALFAGAGYTVSKVHKLMREQALSQVSKGLSSSEELANALTGEKLDY